MKPSLSVIVVVLLFTTTGCGQMPVASVSHPNVYPGPYLARMVNRHMKHVGVAGNMNRYFLSPEQQYSPMRLDGFLDQTQRSAMFIQQFDQYIKLALSLNLLKSVESPATPAPAPVDPIAKANAEKAAADAKKALLDTINSQFNTSGIKDVNPHDSAFDRLDRASDYYTAFAAKYWRTIPDGNAQAFVRPKDPEALADQYRQLFLLFQVAVDPGTEPNQMVGVRVRVTGVKKWGKDGFSVSPADIRRIKIQRLHPTRTYDLEDVDFTETIRLMTSLAFDIVAPLKVGEASGSATSDSELRAQARRRFLTRISKQSAYVDAGTSTFGWNFFPTRLEVVKKPLSPLSTEAYSVKGFLDPGGRDCVTYISAPANVEEIECEISHFHAEIMSDDWISPGTNSAAQSTGRMTFRLPPFTIAEARAAKEPGRWLLPIEVEAAIDAADAANSILACLNDRIVALITSARNELPALKDKPDALSRAKAVLNHLAGDFEQMRAGVDLTKITNAVSAAQPVVNARSRALSVDIDNQTLSDERRAVAEDELDLLEGQWNRVKTGHVEAIKGLKNIEISIAELKALAK